MLAVFSPIFVAGTKITFVYNFVAPLMIFYGKQYLKYFKHEQKTQY